MMVGIEPCHRLRDWRAAAAMTGDAGGDDGGDDKAPGST